jgi:CRISPR system Cascade subunit CasB
MAATIEPTAAEKQAAAAKAFVAVLEKLNPGDKARLKRHAGMSLEESSDVYGTFFRILPHDIRDRKRQEAYFLIATLFPLADDAGLRNLGMTMRRMRADSNQAGLDRRIAALLDADREQLPFRLRQLVRLAHANRVGINWSQLLHDVIRWDYRDRRVQKSWAMSYFASHDRDDPQPDAAEDDSASERDDAADDE